MRLRKEISDSFRSQADACRRLGSPFTARVLMLVADGALPDGPVAERIDGWRGDPASDALALRLAGGLHRLARNGQAPDLAAAYPPNAVAEPVLEAALRRAATDHAETLRSLLDAPPQTNEVGRSGALMGALQVIVAATGCSLDMMEIGASAGLNLLADRWSYDLGDGRRWGAANAPLTIECRWQGPVPPLRHMCVMRRRGCDIRPVDPGETEDRERLLSYIWPDQEGRLVRTQAALDHAARHGVRIDRADAAAWVSERLAEPAEAGVVRVLMHSIMWQYLSEGAQREITGAMVAAAASATHDTPMAWLRVEADGPRDTAAIILTTWPRRHTRELGRADFHGRFVHWSGER